MTADCSVILGYCVIFNIIWLLKFSIYQMRICKLTIRTMHRCDFLEQTIAMVMFMPNRGLKHQSFRLITLK